MKTRINLEKAVKVYYLLKPYVIEPYEGMVLFDYVNAIIKNILESKNYDDYIVLLKLLTDVTDEDLKEFTPEELFELLVTGIEQNEVLSLMEFMKGLQRG